MKKINILITGHSESDIKTIEAFVRGLDGIDVKTSYSDSNEVFKWPGKLVEKFADIIIVNLGHDWNAILEKIPTNSSSDKLLIVFGPKDNMPVVRQAMKIGAEDYLSFPIETSELADIFNAHKSNILKSKRAKTPNQIISIIGSRGGVGSSFLATNIAHICAEQRKLHTALVDFDIQYGVQAMNLDITASHYLKEVVGSINSLDSIAMKGYFTKHSSGIFYLGESINDMPIAEEYPIENVEKLLDNCRSIFDETILDLPHHIDSVFTAVVEKTNRFVLVCQQSIVHIRDVKRIFDILVNEFSVPKDHITVVVNRYNEKYTINIERIQEALDTLQVIPLANDYKRVSMSLDSATPIHQRAENAILTKQISQLVKHLRNEEEEQKSLLRRAFKGIFN